MLHSIVRAVSLLALLAGGALASEFEDALRQDFKMAVYPRAVTTLGAFFDNALGGVRASQITQSNDPSRPFEVDGDTFSTFTDAAERACDNQHNTCADLSNNKTGNFPVSQCDSQDSSCKNAIASATQTSFGSFVTSNSEFNFFCEG